MSDHRRQLAREFIEGQAAGDYETPRERLDGTMKSLTSAQVLADIWAQMVERLGRFEGVVDATGEPSSDGETVFLLCRFERAPIMCRLIFNERDQVAGFCFYPHEAALG